MVMKVQTSFAQRGNQKERRCFRCGDRRHISPDRKSKLIKKQCHSIRYHSLDLSHTFLQYYYVSTQNGVLAIQQIYSKAQIWLSSQTLKSSSLSILTLSRNPLE